MGSYLTRIGVLNLHEIKKILLYMLFQINIKAQNVLHTCSLRTTRRFLKVENKIDCQCIM